MIQFSKSFFIANSDKITDENWQNIVAVSSRPQNMDFQNFVSKNYYKKWKIKREDSGFIFREINTNYGINGHHQTVIECISQALNHSHINVFLES